MALDEMRVADSSEGNESVISLQTLGYTLGDTGLAYAGRPVEENDLPLGLSVRILLMLQFVDCDHLLEPGLDFIETVYILVEDMLGVLGVPEGGGELGPRNRKYFVEIHEYFLIFWVVPVHLLKSVYFPFYFVSACLILYFGESFVVLHQLSIRIRHVIGTLLIQLVITVQIFYRFSC